MNLVQFACWTVSNPELCTCCLTGLAPHRAPRPLDGLAQHCIGPTSSTKAVAGVLTTNRQTVQLRTKVPKSQRRRGHFVFASSVHVACDTRSTTSKKHNLSDLSMADDEEQPPQPVSSVSKADNVYGGTNLPRMLISTPPCFDAGLGGPVR